MSEPDSKLYSFGDFLVDVRRRRLLRGGEHVPLTPKAFDILLALVRRRGEIIEKDELLREVWPDQFIEDSNLTVNMSALRKALGERASESRYVVTVPRRGYRFVADVKELEGAGGERAAREDSAGDEATAACAPTAPEEPPQPEVTPTNLPVQLTPFVGRGEDVASVEKLIRREDVRLVTFTGPGGSGKTRLALHVAARLTVEFPHGVFFVALEPISDPLLVTSTIAQTLGVKEAGGANLVESLKNFLKVRRLLLVLDNFEQVVSAAPILSNLLSATHRLKILVTSRAVLRISGEHEFQVPPLLLPDPREPRRPRVPELMQYASVELFVQRAIAAKSDFSLTERNAHAVAEICVQLDGLPLAIELAAARVRVLPPQAMLARLDAPFKVLTGGARNLPMRQQTMSGAIAWSYDLLDEPCKRLFRRLSVFVAGATLEAAVSVCDRDGDLGLDVQDGVATLVDNSLLRQAEYAGGEPRFLMLETIREYGLERLRESGEMQRISRLHAETFLALAEEADPQLGGERLEFWLEQLEQEHDNIRAALQWSLDAADEEIALRLVRSLWWFWYLHGHYSEGAEWLRKVLAATGTQPSSNRARSLIGAGVLAFLQCEYRSANEKAGEALRMSREVGDHESAALALQVLGSVARECGDYELAVARHHESFEIWRELGDRRGMARSLNYIGFAAWLNGDFDEATLRCTDALARFREQGDREGVVWSFLSLAAVAYHSREHDRAMVLGQESLALSREIGYKEGIAWSLDILGNVARRLGETERAVSLLQESLQLHYELGDRWRMASVIESLACVAEERGARERAVQLFAAAEFLREAVGAPLPPVERADRVEHDTSARASLGESRYSANRELGRALPVERVIACALQLLDDEESEQAGAPRAAILDTL